MLAAFAVPAMAQISYDDMVADENAKTGSDLVLDGANVHNNGGSLNTNGSNKYYGEIVVPETNGTTIITTLEKYLTVGTFQYSYVTSVKLPKTITTIGQATFADCPYLNYIEVDDANTTFFDEDGIVYKYNGTNPETYTLVAVPGARQTITIKEGTTEIANCAFDGCYNITEVVIPETVTKIGMWAFAGSGIETITCLATTPPNVYGEAWIFVGLGYETDNDAGDYGHGFNDMLNDYKDITVYVPAGSGDTYNDNADWTVFSPVTELGSTTETTFELNEELIYTWTNVEGVDMVSSIGEIHITSKNTDDVFAAVPEGWILTYEDGTTYDMYFELSDDNKTVIITFGEQVIDGTGNYTLSIPAGSLVTKDNKECIETKFQYTIMAPQTLYKDENHYVALHIYDSADKYEWSYTDANGKVLSGDTKHTVGEMFYLGQESNTVDKVTTVTNHRYYSTEVQYERVFKNTEWQALYVPFAMDYSDWSSLFDVAKITGVYDNGADSEIMFYVLGEVLESGSTEANTPYLIRAKTASETTPKVLQVTSGETLEAPVENTLSYTVNGNTYKITGQYTKAAYTNDGRTFAMAGGALKQPAQGKSVTLGACRWVLTIDAANSGATFSFGRFGNEGTTGINEVTTENANVKGIYDLQGRKIDEITKPGLYIVDGKKVLVK